ncbi:MAG: T9SS type A sorting domain-containing protein, partial [Saprospiraceae bacterium]|nr:T9SS type A sorting domain-containing protein [Saprospiraceae bacterium]
NLHWDEFNGSFYSDHMIKDNYYYLLESALGQTHSPRLVEGYFLHKINLTTGEADWVHYDNFFSGNDFVETSFGGNMEMDQNENILVNGFKSLDSIKNIEFDILDFRIPVNVMRDVIDQNGVLIDHRVDLDTSRTEDKIHPTGFFLKKVSNKRQIKHRFNNVFEDGFVQNFLQFYDIDEEGIASDTPTFSYKHTTIVDFNAPFLSYVNQYFQLNENSGVALFGSIDQSQGNIPSELKLVFFDTSNSPAVEIVQEKDILDILPDNTHKSTGSIEAFSSNGYFCLYQRAIVEDENGSLDQYLWLKSYDKSGNLIQSIDKLQIDDIDIIAFVRGFHEDNTLYLLAVQDNGGPNGEDKYYLIKSEDINNYQVLSSFVKSQEYEDVKFYFNNIDILENNDVIMYLNIDYPSEGLTKNASFLCRFYAKDFGLPTHVKSEEQLESISITPNPSSNYIELVGTTFKIEEFSIVNELGNTVLSKSKYDQKIDVSHLISGSYFVRYRQNNITNSLPFIKL